MLQQWEQGARQARQRKGQFVRDHPPAQQLVARFMMRLQMAAFQRNKPSPGYLATSQLPLPYTPCVRPVSELEPVFIVDMKLETHHRGKRVIVRVLTPPDRMTAVMAIVEDEHGTAVLLQSYYQAGESTVPANEIMQEGDVFIVKEPFFKVATDGSYTLRVDHLSDLMRLADGDDRIPSPWARRRLDPKLTSGSIRLRGNTAVQAMKWAEANRLYTSAIEVAQTSEDGQLARLNRSLTSIRLNRPAQALLDAELAIKTTGPSEKGFFRAARALYELGEFAKCLEALQQLTARWPTNVAAKTELERAKARIQEQETGVYSFSRMYEQAKAMPPLIDCATFSAPVEIRSSPGRGNGLFTTVPVTAGQLLVSEKAFGYSYAGEDQPGSMSLMVNMSTKEGVMGGQVQLLNQVIQKMYNDPRARDLYQDLHRGDYAVPAVLEVDGYPVIDSFLVAEIMRHNVFGAPKTSRESLFKRSTSGKDNNSGAVADSKFSTAGIWLLSSRINHSCVGNYRRSFIGDMLIIRAARDLPAGTELFWAYRTPENLETYSEVQKGLTSWGFTCACELCLSREKTTTEAFTHRRALHKRLTKILNGPQPTSISAAQKILSQMEETYPASGREPGAIRLELWEPYFALGALSVSGGKAVECVEMVVKGLESLGFVITAAHPGTGRTAAFEITRWGHLTDMVPWAFLHLHTAYQVLAPEVCMAVKLYAGIAYSILAGEQETFVEEHPELM